MFKGVKIEILFNFIIILLNRISIITSNMIQSIEIGEEFIRSENIYDGLKSIETYNTDTYGSWGIGEFKLPKVEYSFSDVLFKATQIKASVIVEPSRGKYWYIKGLNNKKTFNEIKQHLYENKIINYKNKSKTWLINYK